MNNIYDPPKSDLASSTDDRFGNIAVFSRFNTVYTIILAFLTLGLYFPYWLYTRTLKLNAIVKRQTSLVFMRIAVLLYVATYALYFAQGYFEAVGDEQGLLQYIEITTNSMDLISNLLLVIWVYKFRNRLNETFGGPEFRMGLVLPFFFSIFYLQYKINELIDEGVPAKTIMRDDTGPVENDATPTSTTGFPSNRR